VGIGPVEIVRPCCAVVTGSLKATLATTARAPAAKDASSGMRLSGAFSKYRRRKAVTFSPSAVETGGFGERILKEDLIDQRCDDVGRVAHNRDGAVEVGLLADGLGDPKIGDLNPTS
jgi:hypothetical protein